jgi:hypothetical protein
VSKGYMNNLFKNSEDSLTALTNQVVWRAVGQLCQGGVTVALKCCGNAFLLGWSPKKQLWNVQENWKHGFQTLCLCDLWLVIQRDCGRLISTTVKTLQDGSGREGKGQCHQPVILTGMSFLTGMSV